MNKYVAFLRGINVGGIKVPMKELKDAFENLGFKSIKTFLQTGNVVFESDKDIPELKSKIEIALTERFRYQANVLLYLDSELKFIVNNYPWQDVSSDNHRYVVFVADEAAKQEILLQADESNLIHDKIASGEGVIYWQVPKGMTLESIFGKIIAKSAYKKVSTTRNLNTLEKMVGSF
jgi:uncharacterized protein (DUF1697 family)